MSVQPYIGIVSVVSVQPNVGMLTVVSVQPNIIQIIFVRVPSMRERDAGNTHILQGGFPIYLAQFLANMPSGLPQGSANALYVVSLAASVAFSGASLLTPASSYVCECLTNGCKWLRTQLKTKKEMKLHFVNMPQRHQANVQDSIILYI